MAGSTLTPHPPLAPAASSSSSQVAEGTGQGSCPEDKGPLRLSQGWDIWDCGQDRGTKEHRASPQRRAPQGSGVSGRCDRGAGSLYGGKQGGGVP